MGARDRAHGESALFYGHLVGELVRRVDGRSVGRFLAEEICGPAGLDFAFGLSPAQQARAVDLTGLDDAFRAGNAAGRPALYRLATANPPGAQDGAVVNSAAWRAAEIPAVNGHGTAALAGMPRAWADPDRRRPACGQLRQAALGGDHRPALPARMVAESPVPENSSNWRIRIAKRPPGADHQP